MDSAIRGRRGATAARNTQLIHKSYPGVCTQHVDNAVDWLGITRGESVGNTGRAAGRAQRPGASPPARHSCCAPDTATACGNKCLPRIHSTYDYDVLLTKENRVQ